MEDVSVAGSRGVERSDEAETRYSSTADNGSHAMGSVTAEVNVSDYFQFDPPNPKSEDCPNLCERLQRDHTRLLTRSRHVRLLLLQNKSGELSGRSPAHTAFSMRLLRSNSDFLRNGFSGERRSLRRWSGSLPHQLVPRPSPRLSTRSRRCFSRQDSRFRPRRRLDSPPVAASFRYSVIRPCTPVPAGVLTVIARVVRTPP